jgi:hypothetical protein
MSKVRPEVPEEVAARLLFDSDRTCCVCRIPGKHLQIHHIDEDHSNHDPANLSAVCFDCHGDTQIRGGFGRKLDAAQVRQYRDDWHQRVAKRRDTADYIASARAVGVTITSFGAKPTAGTMVAEASASGLKGESDLLAYIRALPAVRTEAYRRAHELWDTGVTAKMMQASHDVIDVLERALVHLASWYPRKHFGDGDPAEYMNAMTASRFQWHRASLEPRGSGTGGTIVGPRAAAAVMDDLEDMITDMVHSLTMLEDSFDYRAWEVLWRTSK